MQKIVCFGLAVFQHEQIGEGILLINAIEQSETLGKAKNIRWHCQQYTDYNRYRTIARSELIGFLIREYIRYT